MSKLKKYCLIFVDCAVCHVGAHAELDLFDLQDEPDRVRVAELWRKNREKIARNDLRCLGHTGSSQENPSV